MTINLTRRSTKGSPLSATDHDGNLDKIEVAIEAREALGAVAAHAAAADPHPGYLTPAEATAAYATTAQGAKADTAIQPGNAALSDSREWSATTIDQAEAEAGTATTRRAFTAQRVFQAVAAWWAASTAKTKLDSITVDSATVVRKLVRNNSGASIPKGSSVYQTGSSGTTLTIALADASAEATAAQTLGLTQETIANNADGYVVTVGLLDGINTSALIEGQIIWLSETAGGLTTTRPTQPAHGVVCGYCVKQGSGTSGILYVKVDNGLELSELHDVLTTGATAGVSVLGLAVDGLWKPKTLAAADISGLGTSSSLDVAATGNATTGQVVKGNDTRLSDDRTPTAHNQAASTITGLATVATSGSATDLTTGTLPAARIPATAVTAGAYTNASVTVDAAGRLTAASSGPAPQPLDADLTAIAALSTASAGRSLLTLAAVPSGALVGTNDTQTLTGKTLGSLQETVFTITDAAAFEINPANGPIQTVTLGANRTPAATNFASGQSVKLKIDDGSAFAITWTTVGVVWIGQTAGASGAAPTLGTTGWTHIELWKEGSIIYGALIGYSAT